VARLRGIIVFMQAVALAIALVGWRVPIDPALN
jgi:hypothetical protein